jgi:hypothetical protein
VIVVLQSRTCPAQVDCFNLMVDMVVSVIYVFNDIELIHLNQLVILLFNNDQLIKPTDGLVCMSLKAMFVLALLKPLSWLIWLTCIRVSWCCFAIVT